MGTTLLACIPWTVIGVITGLVFQLGLIPYVYVRTTLPIPGGLPVAGGLAGVIIGVINGLTFGALLLVTERGKNLDDVRGWRFAIWSALATAVTLGFVFQSLIAAGIGGVLGAIGGAGALWLARRMGERTALATATPPAHDRLGIISNGNGLERRSKLERTGIAERFEAVHISTECGQPKPAADRACRVAAVALEDAVYVGDLCEIDALGARRAGLRGA